MLVIEWKGQCRAARAGDRPASTNSGDAFDGSEGHNSVGIHLEALTENGGNGRPESTTTPF